MTPAPTRQEVETFLNCPAAEDDPLSVRMARELLRLMGENEWRDIASAPRDGTPVIVAVSGGDYFPRSAWYDNEIGHWLVSDMPRRIVMLMQPTHWMPLPQNPIRQQPTESTAA